MLYAEFNINKIERDVNIAQAKPVPEQYIGPVF